MNLHSDILWLLLPLGLFLFAVAATLILRDWRLGLLAALVLSFLEDFIRRLIPGQPAAVMLIKDAVLLVTYFSFLALLVFKGTRLRGLGVGTTVGFMVFCSVVVIQCFNPLIPSVWFAAIGLRNYLWYAPVLVLGMYYFRDAEHFERVLGRFVLVIVVILPVAVVQYLFYDIDHPLIRPFAGSAQFHSSIDPEGYYFEAPQISSIFGSSERFCRVAMMLTLLAIGLRNAAAARGKPTTRATLLAVVAFVSAVMSARRMGIFLAFAASIWLLSSIATKGRTLAALFVRRALGAQLVIGVSALVLVLAVSYASDIGWHLLWGVRELPNRLEWVVSDIGKTWEQAGPFGHGTGTAAPGLSYVPGGKEHWFALSKVLGLTVETGPSWVYWELGVVGLLVYGYLVLHLVSRARRSANSLEDPALRNLAQAIFVYSACLVLWFLKTRNIFTDGPTAVQSLFFLGALFALPNLHLQKRPPFFSHAGAPQFVDLPSRSTRVPSIQPNRVPLLTSPRKRPQ